MEKHELVEIRPKNRLVACALAGAVAVGGVIVYMHLRSDPSDTIANKVDSECISSGPILEAPNGNLDGTSSDISKRFTAVSKKIAKASLLTVFENSKHNPETINYSDKCSTITSRAYVNTTQDFGSAKIDLKRPTPNTFGVVSFSFENSDGDKTEAQYRIPKQPDERVGYMNRDEISRYIKAGTPFFIRVTNSGKPSGSITVKPNGLYATEAGATYTLPKDMRKTVSNNHATTTLSSLTDSVQDVIS